MNIELVRLTSKYEEQLFEMLTEWKKMGIPCSVIGFSRRIGF